ncbi:MAG: sulfite exporter TauE/SafE family protein [Reyranella sp.]|uniref:sulfite exporter TauE/SafE family protein n=1 Tax=Reyranella sp. TaxID=1929291 RepID=UPI003D0BACD9
MDLQYLMLIVIGFVAQMIDGALGMAFGVIATSSLIAINIPPAIASATIHAAEVVTTAISGASHVWNGNVDRKLLVPLATTGVAGGVFGAFVLTGLPEGIIKPIVTIYLGAMSILILARVIGWKLDRWRPSTSIIGAGGGFLDAVGGGGWGPLVASTLMASGDNPRRTVGSVNLAEFFVTLSVSVAFLTQLDFASYGYLALGLIIGGAMAAPLAGYLVRILPTRLMLTLVGSVVGGLCLVNLASFWMK